MTSDAPITERTPHRLSGVYAITDAALTPPAQLLDKVEQALQGGTRIVQYRDKSEDTELRLKQACALVELCRAYAALLVVNDDIELAKASRADGVHIGRDDAPLAAARQRLGTGCIVGVSCYDSLARAERAVADGADYIAFGSFFSSAVKPRAVRPPISLLAEAKRRWHTPVCAIGGINADNAPELIAGGADMIAVISALFAVADTLAAARALRSLFA